MGLLNYTFFKYIRQFAPTSKNILLIIEVSVIWHLCTIKNIWQMTTTYNSTDVRYLFKCSKNYIT